jgi:hypothetical protein
MIGRVRVRGSEFDGWQPALPPTTSVLSFVMPGLVPGIHALEKK